MKSLATLISVLPLALALPQAAGSLTEVDRWITKESLRAFLNERVLKQPFDVLHDGLDWSADGCSVPVIRQALDRFPNLPKAWDFAGPCTRHDFGYRNYPMSLPKKRTTVDDKFNTDMLDVCETTTTNLIAQRFCQANASLYYLGVRAGGAKYFGRKGKSLDGQTSMLSEQDIADVIKNIEDAGKALAEG